MIEIERFDPRKDIDTLKELFDDFTKNRAYFTSSWQEFEEELKKRALDLQYRNSMVIAREDGRVVGWGTYTIFRDYLGNDRVLINQGIIKKADTFKKGIEEKIIRELQSYIKKTLKIEKTFLICPDTDGNMRSILMKLNAKKSKYIWYELES